MAVNSPYLPELNTPFGGIKQSGQGRELGAYGLYSYLEPQSVHIKYISPHIWFFKRNTLIKFYRVTESSKL